MAESPVILILDDDLNVLSAVTRDLRARYGERFRVMPADSGVVGLETLQTLIKRRAPLALLLVDQRMPEMDGIEFLRQALELVPAAKRVLLTAYADTNVAIAAINDVQLDHYLLKPWDPPEEHLYPVLDDLLEQWSAGYIPPFEGVQVIGPRWSARTFEIKEFLARNLVPYRWLDVENDPEALRVIGEYSVDANAVPLVILENGEILPQPDNHAIADRIGLGTRATLPFYDMVVVGAGPAGLAAAVYGASEGLRTLIIERNGPGGQAGSSARIENYLGFPAGLSGADLARRAVSQARRLGAEFLTGEVIGVRISGQYRIVQLASGEEVNCHALLITAGVNYRRLDAPGVERLTGAGIYYGGALSEAISTRGEQVYIVGGGNSAGQAAVHFAGYADCVTLILRGDDLGKSGMSRYLIDRINQTPNIQVRARSTIVEAIGADRLEALRIQRTDSDVSEVVQADDLFIFIGATPHTGWIDCTLAHDPAGYLLTGPDLVHATDPEMHWPLRRDPFLLESNVPGIFVAGDVRHHSIKRIASATGEGAMAISFVHQYLSTL